MSKITASAKGEDCQVRLPGVCNFNPETTVLAHLNGGGMGMKHLDIHASYCCSACHDAYDARVTTSMSRHQLNLWFMDGILRTQVILLEKGLIKTA